MNQSFFFPNFTALETSSSSESTGLKQLVKLKHPIASSSSSVNLSTSCMICFTYFTLLWSKFELLQYFPYFVTKSWTCEQKVELKNLFGSRFTLSYFRSFHQLIQLYGILCQENVREIYGLILIFKKFPLHFSRFSNKKAAYR